MSFADNPGPAAPSTDQLAAGIRDKIFEHPVYAAVYRANAERLAAAMRERLPQITAVYTGALMIHLSTYLAEDVRTSVARGLDPDTAVKTATNTIGMAGVALYGDGEGPAAADYQDSDLERWLDVRQRETGRLCTVPDLCDVCRRTVTMLQAVRNSLADNARLRNELDALLTQGDEDLRVVEDVLEDFGGAHGPRSIRGLHRQFEERIDASREHTPRPPIDDTSARFLEMANRTHLSYVPTDAIESADDAGDCTGGKPAAAADHTDLIEQLRVFLTHFRQDDDTEVIEEIGNDRLTVGMLRAAATELERPETDTAETHRTTPPGDPS